MTDKYSSSPYHEPMVTDEIRLAFAERLNEALDDIGVPPKGEGRQAAVGKRYGVSQHGARKWIEGEAMPELTRAIEIALDLGVTTEWLLSGRGEKRIGSYPKPGGGAGQVAEEPQQAYAFIRRDNDLIREILAGVLGPLGMRLDNIDIDAFRGMRMTAKWSEPPMEHRRGLSAVAPPPAPDRTPLPGELIRKPRAIRKREAS